MHCEDCGTKMYGGICSNCQEELYIIENQSDAIDWPLSEEFTDKAAEQRREIDRRQQTNN